MKVKSAKLWVFLGVFATALATAACGDGVTDDVGGNTAGTDSTTNLDTGVLDGTGSDIAVPDATVKDTANPDTTPKDTQDVTDTGETDAEDTAQPDTQPDTQGDTSTSFTLELTAPTKGQIVNPQGTLQVKGSMTPSDAGEPVEFVVTDESGAVILSGDVTDTSKIAVDLAAPATPGTHKWTVTVKGKTSGKVLATKDIEFVVNSLPTAAQVSIQPQPASTTDALKAQLDVPATDADGQPITYTYTWSKDGQPTGQTGESLPAGVAKKGEVWTVTVIASDGVGQGPAATATVIIGNAAPVPAVLTQLPAETTLTSGIAAVVLTAASDPDGDTLTTTYEWQVDGTVVPGITSAQVTLAELAAALGKPIAVGQVIGVVANTSDDGATVTSQAVTTKVGEGALCPTLPALPPHVTCTDNGTTSPTIACDSTSVGDGQLCLPIAGLPGDSTPVIASNATVAVQLGGAGTSTDGPFDIEIFDENGLLVGSAVLPSSDATVTVEAKPNHPGTNHLTVVVKTGGKVLGSRSGDVYVNTPPTAPAVAIEPNAATSGAELKAVLTAPATDPDTSLQQVLTYLYTWTVDGQPTQYTGESVPAGVVKKGQLWQVSVVASDGVETGLPGTATLTVGNTGPDTPQLSAEPATVGLLGTITIVQSNTQITDADGDPVTTTYTWTVDGVPVAAASGNKLAVLELANGGALIQVGSVVTVVATASDGTTSAVSQPVSITITDADAICGSVLSPCAAGSICKENGSFQPSCACPDGASGNGKVCLTATIPAVGLAGELTQVAAVAAIGAGAKKPLVLQLLDSNGIVVATAPLSDGAQTIGAKLAAGTQVWTVQVVDGSGAVVASTSGSIFGNTAPTAPQVKLGPAQPTTLTGVQLIEAVSTDPDAGQTLTYSYAWFKNGTATGITTADLPAGSVKKGELWLLQVTASDGLSVSLPGEATVLIGNAAPAAFQVNLPAKVQTLDPLTATVAPAAKSDADGDPLSYTAKWFIDGEEVLNATGLTLDLLKAKLASGKPIKVGAKVTVTVTASDGTATTSATSDPSIIEAQGGDICKLFNPCDTNAVCVNNGTLQPTCTCKTGYAGDGLTCSDVNECSTNNGGCSANATCSNTPGSFTCACKAGFSGDGKTCTDIDECATNNGGCSANATCSNSPGSFTCTCKAGYTGDGKTCTDINECATNNGGCSADATCTNTAGSFTCACKAGFTGDGKTCTDINECATNNGGCSANATCANTAGSFTCTCKTGYSGDGKTCTDINECATNNGGCSADATCTNTAGSFTCACKAGYTGDGKTCTDVNECATNNGGCDVNANCTNTPGSFTCACKAGLSGDGKTCKPEGCADGTREGFVAAATYPNIAGCSGGWSVAGLLPTTAPKCNLAGGNSGSNPNGTGCSAADLCQTGWHICASSLQVKNASPTGTCTGATTAGSASLFFASLQSGPGGGACGTGSNDLFGCGNLGAVPDANTCSPLNVFSNNVCGSLGAPWSCPTNNGGFDEAINVVKPGPLLGGVLCCRN